MTILFAGGEDGELSGTFTVSTTSSRFRSGYARCAIAVPGAGGSTKTPQATPQSELWFQAVFNNDANHGTAGPWLAFGNGATDFLRIQVGSDFALQLLDGGSWQDLGASFTKPLLDTNIKVTVQIVVDAASGLFRVWLDGALQAEFIGDTRGDNGAGTLDYARLGAAYHFNGNFPTYWSELILADEDTRGMSLITLAPDAAGFHADWAGAWSDVDEITLSDADAITTASDGAVSTFRFTAVPAGSDTILALIASARIARDGTGPGNVQFAARSGGSTSFGPSQAVGSGYETYQEVWNTDPAIGAGWTRAAVNAAELGLKAVA